MKILALVMLGLSAACHASPQKQVLSLGVFHFAFPNNDRIQVSENQQVDLLSDKYQQQIANLALQLAAFEPTHVVVETKVEKQTLLSNQYQQYLRGEFELPVDEQYQLGFRVAKLAGLAELHAVDVWGQLYSSTQALLESEEASKAFELAFSHHPDNALRFEGGTTLYQTSVHAELLRINQPEYVQKMLGNYLIGHFKYADETNPYAGADFESGRWFNRNLRIFRNIAVLDSEKPMRILVIYGVGHMTILNPLFDASPEFERVKVEDWVSLPTQ